ncbi:MAG: hypothetical protein AAFY56_20005 [Pseudomonadota bacterium]
MPDHVKFLIRHVAIGQIIAILSVGAIIMTDFANLGTLMANSDIGLLAVALLTFMLGLTFGSAQMGIAIMLLPYDRGGPTKRQSNWIAWPTRPQPLRVKPQ